jgi:polyisoprenoid-binding protein YceI
MKKIIITILTLTIAFCASAFMVIGVNWNIDPNYSIKFSGKKVAGTFSGLSGNVIFDPNNLQTSKMEVSVDVNSIKTGNTTQDDHAKGDSWFHAVKYPKISFTSSSFSKTMNGFVVNGNLTLRGVTKAVSIPFQFSETQGKGLFVGNFKVNRKDYGIKGNAFGFLVGEEFSIELKVLVMK